ncbi:MAG: hypothetical protein KDA63_00430 [Planctomycetales bacterium]|nr:hypothetical protein [Planctomycetales bacterium]
MNHKSKKRPTDKHAGKARATQNPLAVDPQATVLPIVWMLSVGVTALAEIASLIGALIAQRTQSTSLAMLTGAAMLTAAIVSLIVLALTLVAVRAMTPPPPRKLVAGAVVVGLIPWLALAVQLLS